MSFSPNLWSAMVRCPFRKRAFEAGKPYQLKQHVRIHSKKKSESVSLG